MMRFWYRLLHPRRAAETVFIDAPSAGDADNAISDTFDAPFWRLASEDEFQQSDYAWPTTLVQSLGLSTMVASLGGGAGGAGSNGSGGVGVAGDAYAMVANEPRPKALPPVPNTVGARTAHLDFDPIKEIAPPSQLARAIDLPPDKKDEP